MVIYNVIMVIYLSLLGTLIVITLTSVNWFPLVITLTIVSIDLCIDNMTTEWHKRVSEMLGHLVAFLWVAEFSNISILILWLDMDMHVF